MANILMLSGSPRQRGNCWTLIEQVRRGLDEGKLSVEVIRLHDLHIQPCTACRQCKVEDLSNCVLEDDMQPLYPKIREADALVIASPIYWWNISAQTKLFIDRCDALEGPSGSALKDKHIGLLLPHGGENERDSGATYVIQAFADAAAYIGFHLDGIVHGCGWEPGSIREDAAAMSEALQLGRNLLTTLT